ncbi:ATP-binding protein [Colwelliaceae bacterium 6471]
MKKSVLSQLSFIAFFNRVSFFAQQWHLAFISLVMFFSISTCLSASELATNMQNDENTRSVIRIALPDENTIEEISDGKFRSLVNFLQEYWQIWAIDHQKEVEFVRLPNRLIYSALANNTIDIAALAVFDANKNNLYSVPYAKFKQQIFRRLVGDERNGTQLGIHSNTPTTLNYLAKDIERQYYQDLDVMLAEYKKFDVLYSTEPWLLRKKLAELKLNQEFFVSVDEGPDIYFHATTRRNNRTLMQAINDSFRLVSTTQNELWANKYQLGDDNPISLTLGRYLSTLSQEEKDYILDHNQLYFPVTKNGFPPYIISKNFSHISERGFAIDLTKLTTEKTGLLFKPYYVSNVEEAIDSVTTGEADLFIIAEYTKNREDVLLFSTPFLDAHYSVIYRHDHPVENSVQGLRNEKIAVVKNFNATPVLQQQLPNANFVLFDTVQAAINAVAHQEANVYIGRSLISSYIIKEQALSNLTSQPLLNFKNDAKFAMATLSSNQVLTTLINRTINSISANQFDDMYARWSKTSFADIAKTDSNTGVYKYTIYILAGTLIICLMLFWVYYRELKVRKIAQHKIEKALAVAEIARAEAEKSTQAKATFLARMSHEIRTPMNGVLGMAEALAYTSLNKEQKELLETLNGSARNLLALLNDVLDFSKMDAHKLTLESVPVDLKALAQNIVTGFGHYEKDSNIKIELDCPSTINHQYATDPTRLTQVLNNLLSNAVKFTEQGKITLSISVTGSKRIGRETIDTILISVQDTGIGISEKNQDQLFTPFIQADSEVTRKYGGTGLGLSISQEIIKAMGGEIKLESSPNQGSRFYFSLQFRRAKNIHHTTEHKQGNRDQLTQFAKECQQYRVLIAEDNLVNIKVLTAQLERLGIFADVAENGEQALTMYNKMPYDIIISDCHMPIIDGFELAKRLTPEKQDRPLWLIAITADALSGAAQKCLDAGFDDYMAKPTPQEEVINKLNNAYNHLSKFKTQTSI